MEKWLDRYQIIKSHDRYDLERSAAVFEKGEGLDREASEKAAYAKYKRLNHAKGAAYHLVGITQSKAHGKMKEAQKHYLLYVLHMGALGLNHLNPVPAEIAAQKPDEDLDLNTTAHDSDEFIPAQRSTQ